MLPSLVDSLATSELSTTGGAYSITMDSRLESTGDYLGYYRRELEGPSSAPTGTISWGHDSTFASQFESSATYHTSSTWTIQDNTYDALTVETLTTSSEYTQAFAGTPQGTVSGTETYQRTYEATDRVYSIMFGAYYQNSTYGDTTSWTWNDPNLSTFDPAPLETIPLRPLGSPQVAPVSILAASPTQSVWMPPALIEDPEAAAAEEGEGLTIEGILWGLIPGNSLVDGYQSWKRGDYAAAIFEGGLGGLDLLTLGTASKARGLLAFAGGVAKSRLKGLFIDAAAGEAGNVVGDRFGDEAGLLTELVVSGVLNGKLNTHDQRVLGFAADGGAKRLARRPSTGGRTTALSGRSAEEKVSKFTGVAVNRGNGRDTVPGTGPGGYRVPDLRVFGEDASLTVRGSIIEVKNVKKLSGTNQIRDLADQAKANGGHLEIFTNAPIPKSGVLVRLIQSKDVIIHSIPEE